MLEIIDVWTENNIVCVERSKSRKLSKFLMWLTEDDVMKHKEGRGKEKHNTRKRYKKYFFLCISLYKKHISEPDVYVEIWILAVLSGKTKHYILDDDYRLYISVETLPWNIFSE